MATYRALALRSVDRESEAVSVLDELLDFASRQLNAEVTIDYFATSLANFLLFDDDLQKRNRTECLFLRGLAKLGLRRIEESAADLREALTLDANHMWAQAQLEPIEPVFMLRRSTHPW